MPALRDPALCAVAAFLLAAPASADTVYLSNGNQMEGDIISETKTQLTLDFGYGTTVLNTRQIERIVRSGAKTKQAEAESMKRKKFEAGIVVPDGAQKADALYRKVEGLREKALDARLRTKRLEEERVSLEADFPALREQTRYTAAALQAAGGLSPRDYNAAVVEHNSAVAGLEAAGLRLQELSRQRQLNDAEVHGYLLAYRELQDYLGGAEGAALLRDASPEKSEYLAWLKGHVKELESDFSRDLIPAEERGSGGVMVKVVLNGTVTGRFLVDTGAANTLLYREVADQLRLPPTATIGHAMARVADGRSVAATVVRLDSIAVGRSRVLGSEAAIMDAGGQGFDGLLGMSFLGRFVSRVDLANGRLILEDLK